MEEISTKVLVIGGGPGGYVTAIRAGQLALPTIVVEEAKLGGTCLNVGCIPSKALIHVAEAFHHAKAQEKGASPFGLSVASPTLDFGKTIGWKDGIVGRLTNGVAGLLRKHKVRAIAGKAELIDGKSCVVRTADGDKRIHAEHIVLATGSAPVEVPALPFGGPVISSTEALALDTVPATLVVVGAGYIGLELGMAYAKLGSKVTVVEAADRILPVWDPELTAPVAKRLKQLGVEVLTATTAHALSDDQRALVVRQSGSVDTLAIAADKVLVAVGRTPRTQGFGLEKLDLTLQGRFIAIDDQCTTSMRNVWAVGDVTGEPMLAHRAMAQGEMVAEIIAGEKRSFDKTAIAAVCFTDPEIVSVGLLPDQAKAQGFDIVTGNFPFLANGRAMSQDDEAGFVRIVARADNHLVLGIQAVGMGVAELSSAFALALEMGAVLEDIAGTIHAHPTRGEAFQEAALGALGHALHI
ncbi:dihydrolipoyl dehydrogenase [Corticibacterium sp. UT-5YL-CI-8]|nr:dihydrolipoyl dehydrogenase [Tianweitania sp. UT-5YL-CI-8]